MTDESAIGVEAWSGVGLMTADAECGAEIADSAFSSAGVVAFSVRGAVGLSESAFCG